MVLIAADITGPHHCRSAPDDEEVNTAESTANNRQTSRRDFQKPATGYEWSRSWDECVDIFTRSKSLLTHFSQQDIYQNNEVRDLILDELGVIFNAKGTLELDEGAVRGSPPGASMSGLDPGVSIREFRKSPLGAGRSHLC